MPTEMIIQAPAKVNLWLSVLGRREDGYHELRMVNTLVDLCDIAQVQITGSGLKVQCDHPGVPRDDSNLATKAAKAMLSRIPGAKPGIRIRIEKNIPVAAGLGGGSSDAAAVLKALNKLLEIGLSQTELMNLGLELGADVPFFIFGKQALVEGIGEKIVKIKPLPDWTYVLATPPIQVNTKWAYQNLDQLVQNHTLILTKPAQSDILVYLEKCTPSVMPISLVNDLEVPAIRAHAVVAKIKELMIDFGALASVMSGSGPTVTGIFKDKLNAEDAVGGLKYQINELLVALTKAWCS